MVIHTREKAERIYWEAVQENMEVLWNRLLCNDYNDDTFAEFEEKIISDIETTLRRKI